MVSMAKDNSKSRASEWARWRGWVQAGFLLAWLDPWMVRMHTVCSPVFHCYSCPLATFACPIGVLANFSAIHVFPFAAVGLLVILGAMFAGFVCGWACPFGYLQDLVAKIPARKFTIPAWMGAFRYVVLGMFVLAIPFWYGESHPLFFCRLCPAGALEAAIPNTVQMAISGGPVVWPTGVKMAILAAFVVATLFTWRPWCTVFCPLGAIYGLFNQISFVFLRFRRSQCGGCEVCRNVCADGSRAARRIDSMRCVRCLECTKCRGVTVETALSSAGETVSQTTQSLP